MTVYIPIAAVEDLAKGSHQDMTVVVSLKPAKPERWVKLEIPEGAYGQEATPKS